MPEATDKRKVHAERASCAKWRWAIADADLSAPVKGTLLMLSVFMNADGECFPSIATMARATRQHRSTVMRHLKRAEDAALLMRQSGGSGRATRYAAAVPIGFDTVAPMRPNVSHPCDSPGRAHATPTAQGTAAGTAQVGRVAAADIVMEQIREFDDLTTFAGDESSTRMACVVAVSDQIGRPLSAVQVAEAAHRLRGIPAGLMQAAVIRAYDWNEPLEVRADVAFVCGRIHEMVRRHGAAA